MMGDAPLLAHRLDSEALDIDRERRSTCRVVIHPDFGYPQELHQIAFQQFDLAGKSYGVRKVDRGPGRQWIVWIE
jgi:hypothetical protein